MNLLQWTGVCAGVLAIAAGVLAGLMEPGSDLREGLGTYAGILVCAAFLFAAMGGVL